MLKRILCDKFRPPYQEITFDEGLNIILGDNAGSSAIGKTAFLNVIDYVYGGNAYYSGDIQKNVGLHTIYFEFVFGEEHLFFYRETGNTMSVFMADEQWHYREEMELPQYRRLLAEKYGCLSGSYDLQDIVAHFFRIYGHGNSMEGAPYRSTIKDSDAKSLDFLMALCGQASVNAAIADKAKELGIRISQLERNSVKQDLEDSRQLDANREAIESLNARYAELMSENEEYQFGYLGFSGSLTDPVAEKLNKLRNEVRKLTNVRDQYQTQIDAIRGVQGTDVATLTTEFSDLKRFFPDANIIALADIEHFHGKIRDILNQEAREQIDLIQSQIDRYDTEIERLKTRIQAVGLTRKMANAKLSQCVEIKLQIERLQSENERLEEAIQRREERLNAERELEDLLDKRRKAIEKLQKQINSKMKELYDVITGKQETCAPVLTISEDKTISFETPGNTSESSAFKGLVIYDLALLSLRRNCVPALIHDSNILSRIEKDYLAAILEQYEKCECQVFISMDRPAETSAAAQKLLFKHSLLELASGGGRELYGRSWSKLEQKATAQPNSNKDSTEGAKADGEDS